MTQLATIMFLIDELSYLYLPKRQGDFGSLAAILEATEAARQKGVTYLDEWERKVTLEF